MSLLVALLATLQYSHTFSYRRFNTGKLVVGQGHSDLQCSTDHTQSRDHTRTKFCIIAHMVIGNQCRQQFENKYFMGKMSIYLTLTKLTYQ